MQGLPNIRTVDAWLDGDVSERFPQSKTMAAHNKGELPGAELCLAPGINADLPFAADGYERRLALYLVENIRFGQSMED